MSHERAQWNRLYTRAIQQIRRPPAEVESVPVDETWGQLPDYEWNANSFLVDRLAKAARWLDLGCGTGSFLAAFLQRFSGSTGVGVDASDVAIGIGLAKLKSREQLAIRMNLVVKNLRALSIGPIGTFDLIYAMYSLQFLRLEEFFAMVSTKLVPLLSKPGIFAGTVRSTSRSIPSSYVLDPLESNTYVSHEPHEMGMSYHHYSRDEIQATADLLGGNLVYLHEKRNYRHYDPAPVRAWWDFVIERR
jgi:SAM-dependent methyltransferase